MIRTSTLNINYANQNKLNQLNNIIIEYKKVINLFITKFWQEEKLNINLLKKENKIETWLSARLQQCAGKQAIQVIKSVRKKDKNLRYRKYKKLYSKMRNENRFNDFLNKRFSELNLKWKIKSEYKQDVIEFDERFLNIQFDKNSFDIWIKLSSIGNKIIIKLPSKKHKHFNKYFNNWDLKKSCRLRKDNNFYIDIFFEKEIPVIKEKGDKLGIDIGINKLLSTSDNIQYGNNIKKLLNDLDIKRYASKSYKRKIKQIKNYIGEQINKIDINNYNFIVMEDIKNISRNTKKERKVNKKVRKYLSRWNYAYIKQNIFNKCEERGSYLIFIDPKYTSQTCYSCKTINKANRIGEIYKCSICGYENNADINGALNILNIGLNQEFIVSDLTENKKSRINV